MVREVYYNVTGNVHSNTFTYTSLTYCTIPLPLLLCYSILSHTPLLPTALYVITSITAHTSPTYCTIPLTSLTSITTITPLPLTPLLPTALYPLPLYHYYSITAHTSPTYLLPYTPYLYYLHIFVLPLLYTICLMIFIYMYCDSSHILLLVESPSYQGGIIMLVDNPCFCPSWHTDQFCITLL